MEDFDKYLDRLVENFFDTGKLVLNENYWRETVNMFSDLRNNPQTVDELLNRYDSISRGVYGPRIGELNELMVNGEDDGIEVVDFIEELKNENVDIEQYEDDGVIFPTTDTTDVEDTEETDTEDEVGSNEFIPHETLVTTQNKRKEYIENSNTGNLKRLSIEYDGDTEDKIYVSNLKTLQYILLNSSKLDIAGDDRKKLIEEIKSSKFGKKTEEVLKFFQELYGIEQTGVTDDNTWEKLMDILKNSENSKLGIIDEEDSEVTDRIKNYNKINDEGVSEDKKNLFYGFSLKLFNNLVDKELYDNIEKKQWDDYKDDFESNLVKFSKKDKEVTTIKKLQGEIKLIKDNKKRFVDSSDEWVIHYPKFQDYLKINFDDPLANKERDLSNLISGDLSQGKRKYKVNKEGVEFWSDYISRWNDIDSRENIQKEYVNYRNQESIEFLHEKVITSLKKSLEDKKISIDEVNEVIFSVNDAIYEVYSGDQMDNGKRDKIKGVLKDIINDINLEGDIYEIIDGLQNINVRKIAGDVYEKSFCGCNTDSNSYFIGCNSRDGDQSELFPKAVQQMKTYLDGDNSTSGSTQSAKQIYELIINTATTKANKYDIISDTDVTLTNGVIIPDGKKIEVKKYDEQNEYTLSEFIGLYKKSKDKETYRKQNINYFNKYNEIIEEVVRLLNENDNGLANSFKGEDKMYGVFVGDYQFYGYDQIDLKWSTQSDQNRGKGELRLTLKFSINNGAQPSQWVEGNCNIGGEQPTNESTDRIDNIIENFFDTGNFDI